MIARSRLDPACRNARPGFIPERKKHEIPFTLHSAPALEQHILRNRIVLPPLTRQRAAQPGDIPTASSALYYGQRAGAGLHDQRREHDRTARSGLRVDTRHLQRRTGRRLGSRDRRSTRRRRRDLRAVVACGPRLAYRVAARGAAPVAPSPIAAQKVKAFIETGRHRHAGRTIGATLEPSVAAEIRELVGLYAKASAERAARGLRWRRDSRGQWLPRESSISVTLKQA